jgi:hypothetical protein
MNPTFVGMIVFACTLGGALVGNWWRTTLPQELESRRLSAICRCKRGQRCVSTSA